MTIERGKEWGTPVLVPSNVVLVNNDRHLAHMTQEDVCVVIGGDIWRSLGEPTPKAAGEMATEVRIDALVVRIHTAGLLTEVLASSSVEVGQWWKSLRPFLRQRYVACTNYGEMGKLQLAPRAHPNDGFFDVLSIDSTMSPKQRLLSAKKAKTGTHIPHPNISITRSQNLAITRSTKNETLKIDGVRIEIWDSVEISIKPDYWRVII